MVALVLERTKARSCVSQARTLISAMLILLAAALLLTTQTTVGNEIATTIIGTVLGYWMAHGERAVQESNGRSNPPHAS